MRILVLDVADGATDLHALEASHGDNFAGGRFRHFKAFQSFVGVELGDPRRLDAW